MGEQLYTKQGIATREKLTRSGRKRVPSAKGEKRGKGYLPVSQRITTDDVIDLFKNITLSVAACAGAIAALRKIGNALSKREMVKNLQDIASDARTQIRRSLDTIEIAIKRSKSTIWGKRKREPYGPYGKNKPKYKFQVGTPDEED